MPEKVKNGRQAHEKLDPANEPQRRPEGRSAFERHRTAGGYASLVLAGSTFLSAAAFWDTFNANPAEAKTQVAGSRSIIRAPDLSNLFIGLPQVLPTEVPAEELPVQEGAASQSSVQALGLSLENATLAPGSAFVPHSTIHNVNITFYDCANQGFCGAMYNGRQVYEGAAACSWNLPLGTRFTIVGDPTHRIYTCEDRGLLSNTWVDVFWYYPSQGHTWQSIVGRYGTIEIVSMP